MNASLERVENLVKEIPATIEARLSEADRNRLDKNFQSWKGLLRLYFPIVISAVAFVVIRLMGSIMLTVNASQKKADYEQRIKKLDHLEQVHTKVINLGHLYRDHLPDSYNTTGYVAYRYSFST